MKQAAQLLVAGLLCLGAQAEDRILGHHPAVAVNARAPALDANTFIVAPPTVVTWTRVHANGEHPAVRLARLAPFAGVDGNTFLVQPPATTTWTLGPATPAESVVSLD